MSVERLSDATNNALLQRVTWVIQQQEFVDVLLPWLSALVKHQFLDPKRFQDSEDSLQLRSTLIECLLTILSDEKSSMSERVRQEVQDVCEALS